MKTKNKIQVQYTPGHSARERFVLWLLEKGAPLHYRFCSTRKAWNLKSDDLLIFPAGSLGRTLACFYKKEGFEPIPKAERHDVFHVLLGYSTAVRDEAAMQFFLWGNGKSSPFTVGTSISCAVLFPRQWSFFKQAYYKGKHSLNISKWDFKELLHEDIELLRNKVLNYQLCP